MIKAVLLLLGVFCCIALLNAAVFEHVVEEFMDDNDSTYHLKPEDVTVDGKRFKFKFGFEQSRK